MATRACASVIIPLPLDEVWAVLRDFTFPRSMIPRIESCTMEDGASPQTIGGIRALKWKDGGERKHRLLTQSDIDHELIWELVESNPPAETLAHISRLKCKRVTETNSTYVEWSGEYSSGVPHDFVQFEQCSYLRNLNDIRTSLTHKSLPILYHVREGPSTRVAIVASCLGLPLQVKLVCPQNDNTEFSADRGGVVTKFTDGNVVLLESGATVMYLIDKYDVNKVLNPFESGTPEYAKYIQWFFYTASTIDHLLFSAYKQMYVVEKDQVSEEKLRFLKNTWENQVVYEFAGALANSKFICGDTFTGADIMSGWCLHFAETLGLLEGHPRLKEYLCVLRGVAHFARAFSAYNNTPPFYVIE